MNRSAAMHALCPRCGYDQRGVFATWEESCPLEAVCTECGLTYSCAEVLQPEKFEPRWCVEYCERGPKQFLRSCGGTLARSFLPWRFWSRLRMSHRIRPKRIAFYLAILLLPLVIAYVGAQTAAALYVRSLVQAGLAVQAAQARALATQPRIETDEEAEALLMNYYSREWVETYKENRPYNWQQMVESYRHHYEVRRTWAQRAAERMPAVEGPAWLAVLEAVLLPFAKESRVAIANADLYKEAYPAPRELWSHVVEAFAGRAIAGWFTTDDWLSAMAHAIELLTFGVLLVLLFPISLALLPLSRRKAKVRWAHIGRITAYGLFIPITATFIAAAVVVADGVRLWATGSIGDFQWLLIFVAIAFVPLGTMLWWMFAINRHLKMPHALAVTAVLMLTCFLCALALVYYTMPERLFGPL